MLRSFLILLLLIPILAYGQTEICDNALDDDGDGMIDLNDVDCDCEIVEFVSLIPNPSFEEMECCPNDRSQLDCASDWVQASEPTTDYINTCDYMGWDDFPPPQPFPDGEGIIGFRDGRVRDTGPDPFWKEYTGACLLSPLVADSVYRFNFYIGFVNAQASPPINVSIFGAPSCDYLPFGIGNDEFGCPANDPNWVKLSDVYVIGLSGNIWAYTTIEVIADQDIYAIAIGPDCPPVNTMFSTYYFLDNLLLASLESFDLQISESGHPCDPDFIISVPNSPDFDYQWYLEGIALIGETSAALSQNYGEGSYQVRILDGSSCRLSSFYDYEIPVLTHNVTRSICEDEVFAFGSQQVDEAGTYTETFSSVNQCDSTVTMELNIIGAQYDTVSASILNGDAYAIGNSSFTEEGEYPVTLVSTLGCDSLVLLQLELFDIYFPNAFSPNGDGVNDVFRPIFTNSDVTDFRMYLYNRWGNLVYEGEEWKAEDFPIGVYGYVMQFEFQLSPPKIYKGNVTLIR